MEKILLVEDDTNLAIGIEYSLKSEGYSVNLADTLEKGRRLFDENNYNLILLDVMLPDGSGYELCEEIREKSNVPIIFLTACDEEVNVVLGLDMGGDDYITKPFRVSELMSRIRAVLRRSERKSIDNVLISGDIRLYLSEGRGEKNKEDLCLTPIEFRLLSSFMKNPKQVLTRSSLLERIWDIDGEFIDDNTLSVYIKRLREKIEKNSSKPEYVKTVRGMGYKWDKEVRGD